MAAYTRISELAILAARQGANPNVLASQFVALVALGPPPSRYTPVSELVALAAAQQDNTMTVVSDIVALVGYVSEPTERFNNRSWGFNLDQNQFYVLHLGNQGTFVYDVLSGQWSQWQTQGFVGWNAEAGVEWNGEVYFGDDSLPFLWRMDPESFLDEDFRPIKRVVTGIIPTEARTTLRTGMFVLSAEKEATLDDVDLAYVKLSISDNNGKTFTDRDTLTIANGEAQDLSWRSLGVVKAPGRVYRVEDEGGLVTINGADQAIEGEK